jgi:hypothetical protein
MYNEGGIEETGAPDSGDAIVIFVPLLNILTATCWLFEHPKKNKKALFQRCVEQIKSGTWSWSKFFLIKSK